MTTSATMEIFLAPFSRFVGQQLGPRIADLDLAPQRHPARSLYEEFTSSGTFDPADLDEELLAPDQLVPLLVAASEHCAGIGAYLGHMLVSELLKRRYAADVPTLKGGLAAIAFFEAEELGLEDGHFDFGLQLAHGTVTGTKTSVFLAQEARHLAVFARNAHGYQLAWVDREKAVVSQPVALLGTRVVGCADVSFDRAPVVASQRLEVDDLLGVLGIQALFNAACASATAAAGLTKAWEYACSRYQGGTTVDSYDAVALMYGKQRALVEASLQGLAQAAAHREPRSRRAALGFIAHKIAATDVARLALSDAIQMHGGYGYMRDYGMEKRFRDAVTLSLLPVDNTRLALLSARV